ncbi:GNAT family N-acetyltransferase [Pyruvatibacter sp.]|uniref:GNAT family N-acetyltransferase n=1 Tax=Pyruvatibacter sp. TaxID=1981328 RepID=UPI0032EF6FCF
MTILTHIAAQPFGDEKASHSYAPLLLPLRSRRLVIRDFVSGDLGALHAYAERREVTRYLLWGPNTVEQSRATLAEFIAQQEVAPRVRYDLALALPGGKAIGGISLHLDDLRLGNAEIGYVLHSDYWGGGFASEAVQMVATAAFAQWPLNRLWARCMESNKASRRVLERLGMRHEGTLLRAERLDGAWHNVMMYAVLADEWRTRG